MATIKAIEGRSVHQIQSGQVIVDLCSVVKELVENSLDAGATSIDVRFKNNGLYSIEVQDNGGGIPPEDYQTIALKHYTSKLSNYEDLTSLQTFGFRGEALSSLCALSSFHIISARADDVPKGTRLDFETSGDLKGTKVVASQQGTTVAVENLFKNLPVRRRELEKNIKREYGKVLGVLHAYACISIGVKFGVSHQIANGKKAVVFATKSNPSTRENIANVFGAKTMTALVPLDLRLELQPSSAPNHGRSTQGEECVKEVHIVGHISKPVFGEGRQTPDRQMFFINARPCSLPQVSKAFNEVYRSYNVSQSPFIFANFEMDTNAYDVNVSPDKRTILLHDQSAMLEVLKTSLTELFEKQDQTVPHSQISAQKLPSFRQLTINREPTTELHSGASLTNPSVDDDGTTSSDGSGDDSGEHTGTVMDGPDGKATSLIQKFLGRNAEDRLDRPTCESKSKGVSNEKQTLVKKLGKKDEHVGAFDDFEDACEAAEADTIAHKALKPTIPVLDFNQRIAEQEALKRASTGSSIKAPEAQDLIASTTIINSQLVSSKVQDVFSRMRPKRSPAEVATITIGSKTITSSIGTPQPKRRKVEAPALSSTPGGTQSSKTHKFGTSLRAFAASGTQLENDEEDNNEDDEEEEEDSLETVDVTGESEQTWLQNLEDTAAIEGPGLDDPSDVGVSHGERSGEASLALYEEGSSDNYLNERENKVKEEAKVAQMIQIAEESAARPSQNNAERARRLLKGNGRKDSSIQIVQVLNNTVSDIEKQLRKFAEALEVYKATDEEQGAVTANPILQQDCAEERLSLAVAKDDFARMRIIGQFNLGFILATRPAPLSLVDVDHREAGNKDEVFIIDQHASDEKYNFERLQLETTVQNQRLVMPRLLDLTAIEEEIIIENPAVLEKNGFLIEVDSSGDAAVGKRCRLISLPMSREVVFNTRDLEELLALVAESPPSTTTFSIPRPSKVRRMFAMRACRSSVMIGKTLTRKQMGKIVKHMGEIDKPWNCPHGRPTMRHLMGLSGWDSWREGDGPAGLGDEAVRRDDEEKEAFWTDYIEEAKSYYDVADGSMGSMAEY
ncbi:MAG: hypothetical protein M1830_005358 [Pleopsidium flavum]|nr:MAG: hypothetical protein M1830_005358 [Pleopsidium flavum]